MALLEVKNVKKIYTTRFGGNHVADVSHKKANQTSHFEPYKSVRLDCKIVT